MRDQVDKNSEDYIRDLAPKMLRYDMTLDKDLTISVLPNGIKTWVFLYEYQGRHCRKTLGVYPEMSHGQAVTALRNERNMIKRQGGDVDRTVDSNSVADAASFMATAETDRSASAVNASYHLRPRSAKLNGTSSNARPKYLFWSLLAAVMPVGGYSAFTRFGANGSGAPTPIAGRPEARDVLPQARLTTPGPAADNTKTPATGIDEELAGVTTAQAPTDYGPVEKREEATALEPPLSTPAPTNTVSKTGSMKPEPVNSRVEPPLQATAVGGTVARAIIASSVDSHEPVDDLGTYVALKNNGDQRVFFFTEMRNFSDGLVIHRWEHKGRILSDVPLRVARSSGWRTYSSKRMKPHMTGDWRVSVIDARGRTLASRLFTFDR